MNLYNDYENTVSQPFFIEEISGEPEMDILVNQSIGHELLGRTNYDGPGSKTDEFELIAPAEDSDQVQPGTYVEVDTPNGDNPVGVIDLGPFFEPEMGSSFSNVIVTGLTNSPPMTDLPTYARATVKQIGNMSPDGTLRQSIRRPRPNSDIHRISDAEVADLLGHHGSMRLGDVEGPHKIEARLDPSDKKKFPEMLAKHLFIGGTTGAGKTNTAKNMVSALADTGMAQIVLDREGEFTRLNEPETDEKMKAILESKGLEPRGIKDSRVYYLAGKEPSNPEHPNLIPFSAQFASMSETSFSETMNLNEAGRDRLGQSTHITRLMDSKVDISTIGSSGFGTDDVLGVSLSHLSDVVDRIINTKWPQDDEEKYCFSEEYKGNEKILDQTINSVQLHSNKYSWLKLKGILSRLRKQKIFDVPNVPALDYQEIFKPERVSIVDLSGVTTVDHSNLALSQILLGIRDARDKGTDQALEIGAKKVTVPLQIYIDEAHSILSSEKVKKMPELFSEIAEIAALGRKRRLGLTLISHYPNQISEQVFDMVNNFLIHRVTNPVTVTLLKKMIGLTDREAEILPVLEPGQLLASFPDAWERPAQVKMHPALFVSNGLSEDA